MKKLNLDDVKKYALKRNGQCLSTTYINSSTHLIWRCEKGHIWKAKPNNIKNGTWCPECAGNLPRTIDEAHQIAKQKNGKCLSIKIKNAGSYLKWQCNKGHIWEAPFRNVKRGSWCDKCARQQSANKRRGNINEIIQIAKKNEGECLSKTYKNSTIPLLFKCSKGHVWKATPNNVKKGTWCKRCASKKASTKYSIDDAIKIAKKRGGKCLTARKTYKTSKDKLTWQCQENHIWQATLANVMHHKSWCPFCANKISAQKRLKNIKTIHKLAADKGGKCLSNSHKGMNKKILWQCALGHTWEATPSQIQRGRWCPECSCYLGERICRNILEQLFHTKFPKRRPSWLVSGKGNRLELDGFNEKLQIAFEHHGLYHYKIDRMYSKTKEQLLKRQKFDYIKNEICKANNIKIIVIPEVFTLTKLKDIPKIIKNECINKNIPLPNDFEKRIKNIDLSLAYQHPEALKYFEEIKQIANSKEGQCLSKEYISAATKMTFQCSQGHTFQKTPNSIKRGGWCYQCNANIPLTIKKMKQLASSKGGECLSEKYLNAHTKLTWKCKKGHIWEQTTNAIKHRDYWCPYCSGNKLTHERTLAAKCPEATVYWDYDNNNNKPEEIFANTHKKYFFKCSECGISFECLPRKYLLGQRKCKNCKKKEKLFLMQ